MTDLREKLLDATARIYEQSGYRGTTTRRIAAEAGVNEVTLFRHFGSKDELLKAALRARKQAILSHPLDPAASDPLAEVVRWAVGVHARLCEHRALIRRLLSDVAERPDLASDPCDGAEGDLAELVSYLTALQRSGRIGSDLDPFAASHLLIGSLFTDAIWRDLNPMMPEPEPLIRESVRVVLAGLGVAQVHEAGGGA
jgi:AcrR family transcriptional regulator